MLEFIITPRQKYLRNFSLPGELQAYFTSFYLLVCFVGFYLPFFSPSVLFYCVMSYAQYQQVYFFCFVWETMQAINHVLSIFPLAVTNAVQYLLLSIGGTWNQKAGWAMRMLDAHTACNNAEAQTLQGALLPPSDTTFNCICSWISMENFAGSRKARICEGVYGWFVTANLSGNEIQKQSL